MSWPIAFVQEKTASAAGASVGATFDAAPVSGHAIVVVIGWEWSPGSPVTLNTVTDSAGNTYTAVGSPSYELSTPCSSAIYVATNITGEASHQVTVAFSASATCEMNVTEWSGVSFSHSPVDQAAWAASSLINNPPFDAPLPALTATMDGALYIAGWRTLSGALTIDSEPTGLTKLTAVSGKLATYYLIQTTAATVTPVTSYTSSAIYGASVVALFPEHHESPPAGGPLPTGAHPSGTISLRQQAVGYVGGMSALTFITTPKTGSLILVAVSWFARILNSTVQSVTDNAGNTYAAAGPASSVGSDINSIRCQYWYAYNIAAVPNHAVTVTMTPDVIGGHWHLSEWLGVDTASDPLDVVNGNGNTDLWTPYTHSTGEVTPTAHHALVVAAFRSGTSPNPALVPPTGMTALTPVSYLAAYYVVQNAAAAINPTLTTVWYNYVSRVVVFRAIDAVTPPPETPLAFPAVETPTAQDGVNGGNTNATLSLDLGALLSGSQPSTLMFWSKNMLDCWIDFGVGLNDYIYAELGEAHYTETQADGVEVYHNHVFFADGNPWLHSTLVYDGTKYVTYVTHEDLLTFDCAVATSIAVAMPAYASAPVELGLYMNSLGGAIKHLRVWSSALTVDEIKAECRSATVVKTAGLYSDTPFTSTAAVSDISGNGRDWTPDVTLSDYVPVRVVPATPADATTLPFSATPVAVGYGNDWEAWYAVVSGTGEILLGVLATASLASNFRPNVQGYAGSKRDPYCVPWGSALEDERGSGRVPLELPTRPGQAYYIRIANTNTLPDTTPIDGNPTISILAPPQLPVPAGSILITDDTSSFPLAMLDATDGEVLAFYDFSVGDKGIALPNGYFCIQTSYGSGPRPNFVTMYDDQLNMVAAPADIDDDCLQISHNGRDTFYISSELEAWPYGMSLSTLTADGVFAYQRYAIPGANPHRGFVVAHDDSVVYYYGFASLPSQVILRSCVLATGVDTEIVRWTTFETYATDLVMLADGTLLTGGLDGTHVQRWSVDGTLLNTYGPFACLGTGSGSLNRIAVGVDDPQDAWVWIMDIYGYSTFHHINIDDGSTIAMFGRASWTAGRQISDNQTGYPTTIDERFGHSNCCSIIVTRKAIAPVVPTPPPLPRFIRRMRQSPHLSDEQVNLFFGQFQLDLEAGLGLTDGQGVDPQLMLQWSDDGGRTWGEEHWVSAGRLGRYAFRAIWRRLGRARTRTWRVTFSDPVPTRWIDAYVQAQKGTA